MKQSLQQRGGKGRSLPHAAVLIALIGGATASLYRGVFTEQSNAYNAATALDGFTFARSIEGVRQVPSQYATIQAAVDAASYGDTILIAPGTYAERVWVDGKKVTLRGSEAAPRPQIIGDTTGGESLRVSGVGATGTQLEHLAVTGGNGPSGCGLLIDHAEIRVRDCTFNDNRGSGVSNIGSNSMFYSCRFEGNAATVCGGGFRNEGGSPTLTDCTVVRNSAGTFGGGLYSHAGRLTLVHSTISENATTSGAWGGGIYSDASDLLVFNTSIEKNLSVDSGGGAFVAGGTAEFAGCQFIANSSATGWNIGSSGAQVSFSDSTICGDAETSIVGDGINNAGATFTTSCFSDRNRNGRDDAEEIALGITPDCDSNGVPDAQDPDCNQNGIVDRCEIQAGWVHDCNGNGVPDRCEIDWGIEVDSDADGLIDGCAGE
ncbi:MAG: hypothetical protein EXS17_07970 [Phycisphaerales bacterium]|nr:hypothetical protein [Phycisphaerales bacterium]